MIDFACRQFTLDEIIKCGLGLSKADFAVMDFFLKNSTQRLSSETISKKLDLDLSTVQRAVKKLYEQKVLVRFQNNLNGGGYVFAYQIKDKDSLRKLILEIIAKWTKRVESELEKW